MSDTAEPENSRSSFNFDRLAAIFAIGLSFAAMGISLMEVTSIRAQQKADVWPYLEIKASYTGEGFKLLMINKGVGPALTGDVVMTDGGAPIASLETLILKTVGEENAFGYEVYGSSDPSNGVVAPGETYNLFSVPWEDRTRLFVERVSPSIDVSTCYCSIHEDCWTVSMSSHRPEPVEHCKIS